jgi:MFS family permease
MVTQLRNLQIHDGFTSLALSRFISNFGNGLSPIALAYGVLSIPGADGSDLSIVMAARFVPLIAFMLFGGVLGDRFKRNRIVGIVDIIGSFFAAVSAISFIAGFPSIWLLALMGALFGILNALWWPAMSGVLPEILPKEKLQHGNAVIGLMTNIGFIAGTLVGGIVVTNYGSGWALLTDAITFLIAGILVLKIDLPVMPTRANNSVLRDLKLGWIEFSSRSWVVSIVIAFAAINACFESVLQVLGPLAFDKEGAGPKYWSYNLAALTVGMMVGGITALKVKFSRPLVISMVLISSSAIWDFAIALDLPILYSVLAASLAGFALEIFFVNWNTTMQKHIPEESFSRVTSYDAFGSYGIAPLGILLAGPIVAVIGISNALWITGSLTLSVALLSLLVKSIRELRS